MPRITLKIRERDRDRVERWKAHAIKDGLELGEWIARAADVAAAPPVFNRKRVEPPNLDELYAALGRTRRR